MEAAHTILLNHWRSAGDEPALAGGGESIARGIEQRYAVALPHDFRAYLLHAAPRDDFYDNDDVTWWPPSRIKNIPDEYAVPINDRRLAAQAPTCLFFADYFIWASAWVICCGEGGDRGKVALIGASDRIVAGSFTEFVRAYVTDPLSVT
jgi:hypothetical protein